MLIFFSSNNPLQELHFQVSAQEQQCGQSNITLNGQPLISQWDGPRALGAGIIRLEDDQELSATWQLFCLSVEGLVKKASFVEQVAENGGFLDQNAAQVLSIQFENSQPAMKAGFSVSYRQLLIPRIVQFDSHPQTLDDILDHSTFWITQSQDMSPSKTEDDADKIMGYVDAPQKSLHFPEMLAHLIKWELDTVKKAASKAAEACQHKFPGIHQTLHKIHKMLKAPGEQNSSSKNSISGSTSPISLDKIPASSPHSRLDKITTTKPSDSAHPKHSPTSSPVATQIRSLSSSSTSTAQSPNSFAFPETSDSFQLVRPIDPSDTRLHYTKVLGIIIILACFLTWLIKRIRDPRRRADRLARQEERRNRWLYKRAARIQRVRNVFQRFQRSYRRVFRIIVDRLDEKHTRVLAQEEILEDVMKDDISAIISADGLEYDVSAAEEGRNHYIYDPGPSRLAFERRRSVATLPGYESEGTQPPGYEEGSMRTVHGFRCRPTIESEDTPDSSVISTSPRISRDGRDSDFEKEPEWTLDEPSIPFDGGSRQSLSEIRPAFGFRGVV